MTIPDPTAPTPHADLGYQANRLARLLRRGLAAELGGLGFTTRQAAVLLALAGSDGMTMRALADRLGVDKATLSGVVRRLEGDGWLSVVPHPNDRRSRIVKLSSRGVAAAPALELASARLTRHALRDLDGDERERLFALLQRVCATLEDGADGDPSR